MNFLKPRRLTFVVFALLIAYVAICVFLSWYAIPTRLIAPWPHTPLDYLVAVIIFPSVPLAFPFLLAEALVPQTVELFGYSIGNCGTGFESCHPSQVFFPYPLLLAIIIELAFLYVLASLIAVWITRTRKKQALR